MTLETLDRQAPQPEHWPNINPDSVIEKVSGFFNGVNVREVGTHIRGDLKIVVRPSSGGNSHSEAEGYLATASRGETRVAEEFHATRKPNKGLTDYYRLYGNNNGIKTTLDVLQFANGSKNPAFKPAIIEQEPADPEFIRQSVDFILAS